MLTDMSAVNKASGIVWERACWVPKAIKEKLLF